jgi:hypothetical protein
MTAKRTTYIFATLLLGVAIAYASSSQPAPATTSPAARGGTRDIHTKGAYPPARACTPTGASPDKPATAGGRTNQQRKGIEKDRSGAGAASPNAARLAGLFPALRHVESGGNDRAVGDNGRSVGPYQCGLAAWLDGGGKREDYPRLAYDRMATERVMLRYWQRHGAVTDEQRARTWNGGPTGASKKATVGYWKHVKDEMKGKP